MKKRKFKVGDVLVLKEHSTEDYSYIKLKITGIKTNDYLVESAERSDLRGSFDFVHKNYCLTLSSSLKKL